MKLFAMETSEERIARKKRLLKHALVSGVLSLVSVWAVIRGDLLLLLGGFLLGVSVIPWFLFAVLFIFLPPLDPPLAKAVGWGIVGFFGMLMLVGFLLEEFPGVFGEAR